MRTLNTIAATRQQVAAWRHAGERIAFVPTMGNLHEGHIHLVTEAKRVADRVVCSIFVNPMQFGPNEDFERYPRTLADDSTKLEQVNSDLLFAPPVEEIYPSGYKVATQVVVPGVSEGLCGSSRPGHFTGVATVVAKLFNIVQPDIALFGEKDYQQLQVIHHMVADLSFPIEIIGVSTVREADGLAMSSRNGYLSVAERSTAPAIYRELQKVAGRIQSGARDFRAIENDAAAELARQGFDPEYVTIAHADTLKPAGIGDKALRILVAARLGKTRLIDNLALSLLE